MIERSVFACLLVAFFPSVDFKTDLIVLSVNQVRCLGHVGEGTGEAPTKEDVVAFFGADFDFFFFSFYHWYLRVLGVFQLVAFAPPVNGGRDGRIFVESLQTHERSRSSG